MPQITLLAVYLSLLASAKSKLLKSRTLVYGCHPEPGKLILTEFETTFYIFKTYKTMVLTTKRHLSNSTFSLW
jgi:hypothetical protein